MTPARHTAGLGLLLWLLPLYSWAWTAILPDATMVTRRTRQSSSRPTTAHTTHTKAARCSNASLRQSFSSDNDASDAADTNSTDDLPYDLAVIGAGVVGVQAALAAAGFPNTNRRVILIDAPAASGALMGRDEEDLSIGGPTGLFGKALRDTSKRIKVSTLRGMGLREDSVWNEIISSCLDLAKSNADDIRRQLTMAGVVLMDGFASFPDSGETTSLVVSQRDGGAPTIVPVTRILIATGSRPFLPQDIPFDGKRVFDSDSINTLSYLPKSIAITGSGIIAVEYAKIFRNLGADVSLIIRDQVPRKALEKIGLDIE
jgi:NAD(P) transhydrogenase